MRTSKRRLRGRMYLPHIYFIADHGRLANSRAVVRIDPYPACELPETARVPSSHWLDASSIKGDTWDRGRQLPILMRNLRTQWLGAN